MRSPNWFQLCLRSPKIVAIPSPLTCILRLIVFEIFMVRSLQNYCAQHIQGLVNLPSVLCTKCPSAQVDARSPAKRSAECILQGTFVRSRHHLDPSRRLAALAMKAGVKFEFGSFKCARFGCTNRGASHFGTVPINALHWRPRPPKECARFLNHLRNLNHNSEKLARILLGIWQI